MYLNDQDIPVVAHVGVDAAFAPVAVWSIHCAGPWHVGDFVGFRFGIVVAGLSETFLLLCWFMSGVPDIFQTWKKGHIRSKTDCRFTSFCAPNVSKNVWFFSNFQPNITLMCFWPNVIKIYETIKKYDYPGRTVLFCLLGKREKEKKVRAPNVEQDLRERYGQQPPSLLEIPRGHHGKWPLLLHVLGIRGIEPSIWHRDLEIKKYVY